MKKVITMLLLLALASSSMYACGDKKFDLGQNADETVAPVAEEVPVEIKSYADFEAAENLSLVKLETYVQGKQLHSGNKCGIYVENEAGEAYYLFQAGCSKETYDALVPGTKISAVGRKSAEWGDIIEIVDAKIEILEGHYEAPVKDITDLLGDEEALKEYRNKKVTFTYLDVSAVKTAQGDSKEDVHLVLTNGEKNMTFYVDHNMAEPNSLVFQNASALVATVDKVDVTCFLEWNKGMKPVVVSALGHIDTESNIQFKSPLVDGKCSLYIQNKESKSACRVIDLACTQEEYDALQLGSRVKISGLKSGGVGSLEILEATMTPVEGGETYDATPTGATNFIIGKDVGDSSYSMQLAKQIAQMKLEITEIAYNVGDSGKDIKFTFTNNGKIGRAYVEADFVKEDSELYKAAKNLVVGDVVDFYGYIFFEEMTAITITNIVKN